MTRRVMLAVAVAVAAVAALLTLAAPSASKPSPDLTVEVVAAFDAGLGELPEGIAIDRKGDIHVGLGPPFFVGGGFGAVRRIAPDGTQTTRYERPDGPAVAGLAIDRRGTTYFALPDPGGPDAGVYRITDDGAERLAGTEDMLVPNGLAISRRGDDVYVSDSLGGEIRKVSPRDGGATVWLADESLAGCAGDIGVNGIAFWRGDLYAANSSKGLVVRIPVRRDGGAGQPRIVIGDTDCDPADDLFSIDGIAFDVRGRLHATLVLVHELVRIDLDDGTVTTLLDQDDGLWNPASLAFGTARGSRRSLFVTNYAVLPPAPDGNLGPAVLRVDVGTPGRPLP